jgi:hypothetical protein
VSTIAVIRALEAHYLARVAAGDQEQADLLAAELYAQRVLLLKRMQAQRMPRTCKVCLEQIDRPCRYDLAICQACDLRLYADGKRRCVLCGQVQAIGIFRKPDGDLARACGPCHMRRRRRQDRESYARHAEERRAYSRRYHATHGEQHRVSMHDHYEAHRGEYNARRLAWQKTHREEQNTNLRNWRARNREAVNTAQRARYHQKQALKKPPPLTGGEERDQDGT